MTQDVVFRELFLDSLLEIEAYVTQYSTEQKERKFTVDVFGFITDIIAINPFAFVKYESRFPENQNVRRAVFKKEYCIVYEVFEKTIDILNIYHVSRDPQNIPF